MKQPIDTAFQIWSQMFMKTKTSYLLIVKVHISSTCIVSYLASYVAKHFFVVFIFFLCNTYIKLYAAEYRK